MRPAANTKSGSERTELTESQLSEASFEASEASSSSSSSSSSLIPEDLRMTVSQPRKLYESLSALKWSTPQPMITVVATPEVFKVQSVSDDLGYFASLGISHEFFSKYSLISRSVTFSVNLVPLLDALNLYSQQSVTVTYPVGDAQLRLSVEEQGVMSQCLIRTRVSSMERIPTINFLQHRKIVSCYALTAYLKDALRDIDWCDDVVQISFSSTDSKPSLMIRASGSAGTLDVCFWDRDIVISALEIHRGFPIVEFDYLRKHLVAMARSLGLSANCRIRVNQKGVLNVQVLLDMAGTAEKKSYFEAFLLAVRPDDIHRSHDAVDHADGTNDDQ
eukprot:ANDGO_00092.mRNA.1 hypothetical protein